MLRAGKVKTTAPADSVSSEDPLPGSEPAVGRLLAVSSHKGKAAGSLRRLFNKAP